ncbi:helix-turn-helix domain-containing protein [Nocardia noduli]|uniref:helix-turn-helix domain-containing protein n=1 Tax=Nocardia noduli TaxID=2815722 RepID=UPI001C247CE1|nr:helix-turn-helix domain-containing protein [Nocardia noduli]
MSANDRQVRRHPKRLALPDLGEFVGSRRRKRKITQADFAAAIDVVTQTVAKLEQGAAYNPSEAVVRRIGEVLQCTQHERYHLDVLTGRAPESTATFRLPLSHELAVLKSFAADVPAAWVESWRIDEANDLFRSLWPGMDTAPSLLEWWFFDSRAKRVTPNWDWEAEVQVGQLRSFAAEPSNHPRARDLLDRLVDDPVFCDMWNSGVVWYDRPGPRHVMSGGRELVYNDAFMVAGSTSQWGRGLYVGLPDAYM